MNQMSPSDAHFVSHVAPIVATITSFTTFRIGMDIARIAKIGMTVATKTSSRWDAVSRHPRSR